MYSLSYSDLCLPTHFRRRGSLLPLTTLINTHALGRIPLEEGSTRHRGLYLTAQMFKRQTSVTTVWFEPTIPTSERPQTAATGIGS